MIRTIALLLASRASRMKALHGPLQRTRALSCEEQKQVAREHEATVAEPRLVKPTDAAA